MSDIFLRVLSESLLPSPKALGPSHWSLRGAGLAATGLWLLMAAQSGHAQPSTQVNPSQVPGTQVAPAQPPLGVPFIPAPRAEPIVVPRVGPRGRPLRPAYPDPLLRSSLYGPAAANPYQGLSYSPLPGSANRSTVQRLPEQPGFLEPVPVEPSAGTLPTLRSPGEPQQVVPVAGQAVPGQPLMLPAVGEANFQVVIPEPLANRLLSVPRSENSPVRDFVLGANVLGKQSTISTIQVDFHTCPVGSASATLVLNGTVSANTIGTTAQAAIATEGHHQVRAMKDILFDGKVFSTRAAKVYAQVHNQNVGARTALDGTLFGPLANQIALSVANAQRRRSDPIVWQRTVSATFDRFNGEVDRQLAVANQSLEKTIRPKLREWSAMPDKEQVATTDQVLMYSALFDRTSVPSTPTPDDAAPGAAVDLAVTPVRPVPPAEPTTDPRFITVRLHESLLNQAADLLRLEGKKYTEKELVALVQQFVAQIGGNRCPVKLPPVDGEQNNHGHALSLPIEPQIVFADRDPLRFRLADGVLTVILQIRFDVNGKTAIPTQRITIPLKGKLEPDQFVLQRGKVAFESTTEESQQIRQLYEPILRSRLEEAISNLCFPRRIPLPPPLNRRVGLDGSLHAVDGWLTIYLAVE